jgi:hypothetical protein
VTKAKKATTIGNVAMQRQPITYVSEGRRQQIRVRIDEAEEDPNDQAHFFTKTEPATRTLAILHCWGVLYSRVCLSFNSGKDGQKSETTRGQYDPGQGRDR